MDNHFSAGFIMQRCMQYMKNNRCVLLYASIVTFFCLFMLHGNFYDFSRCSQLRQDHKLYESIPTRSYDLKDGEYDTLPSGSPTIQAYEKLLANPIYKQWVEVYSNKFLRENHDILAGYRSLWTADPLHSWSRGWEYTYVAAAIRKLTVPDRNYILLDIGSGVTFIDWMIAYEILRTSPLSRVIAVDNNVAYYDWFSQIHKRYANRAKNASYKNYYAIPKVEFIEHDIQKYLPLPKESIDIALCISVFEHVSDGLKAIRNIFDVIKPGGYLVITFDIDVNNAIVNHNSMKADALLAELRQIGKEIDFDQTTLLAYNKRKFVNDIEKEKHLYTLYEGKKKGLDNAQWIRSTSEKNGKGLFFSCHVFQKPN